MEQPKRVNYFQGMMLVDDDFRDDQNYHRQMLGNHNIALHTWGVVRGLEVSVIAGKLDVKEGMAIDAEGKQIWWKGGDPTPTGTAGDGGYVVIEWSEKPSNEYSQMPGKFLRLIETCTFSFKPSIDPGNDVVLARIRVQGSQIQADIDNTVRRNASSVRVNQDNNSLEIRPVTRDGSLRLMTTLTERLTIAATGNVGIGTTAPDAAKLVVDTAGGTTSSLKCEHRGSNFIVRPQSAGANSTVIENNGGGALLINPGGGMVGIGTANAQEKLDVGGDVRLNLNDLYFKDKSHGIGYYGGTKTFANASVDGPVVYGYSGGVLGSKGPSPKIVLRWNEQGNVGIGTASPEEQLQIGEGIYKIGIGVTPGDGVNGRTQSLWNTNFGTAYLGFNAVRTNAGWRRGDESGKRGASIIYNTLYGDLCFVTVEPEGGEYLTASDIVNRKRMVIDKSGNVSIGRNTAGAKLDVNGVILASSLSFTDGAGGVYLDNWIGMWDKFDAASKWLHIGGITEAGVRRLALAAHRTYITGNVGIGSTQPNAKLEIQGGADSGGASDQKAIAFSHRNGGFRHWIRTRHNATLGLGNAIDFYVNNSTAADGSSAPTTGTLHAMTLDSGKVGIGATSPRSDLHIRRDAQGGIGPTLLIQNGGGTANAEARIDIQTYSNEGTSPNFRLRVIDDGKFGAHVDFTTMPTNSDGRSAQLSRLYIRSDGNVGIGTDGQEKLDVGGDIRINQNNLYFKDKNHGIGYYGGTKTFNAEDINGPVVYGYGGGALGSNQNPASGLVQKIALRWDAQGNIGIGTKLPTSNTLGGFRLAPSDGSPNAGFIRFGDNTGWKLHFGQANSGTTVLNGLSGIIMTLQDQGNVGIGSTSPDGRLEIKGNQSEVKVKFGGKGGDVHHLSSTRDLVFNCAAGGITFRKVDDYGDVSKFTDLMTISSDGNILSPKWNAFSVINQNGPLPISATFPTGGGKVIMFVSGSAFREDGAGTIGMNIFIDGVSKDAVKSYTNERSSHKSLVPSPIVVRLGSGNHTIELKPLDGNVKMDGNDYFRVTILELPF